MFIITVFQEAACQAYLYHWITRNIELQKALIEKI